MIKPLGHQVLLLEIKPPDRTQGGIMIPYELRGLPYEFLVLAKGPDVDPDLSIGSKVILDHHRLNARTQAGEGLWLLPEESILLTVPLQLSGAPPL